MRSNAAAAAAANKGAMARTRSRNTVRVAAAASHKRIAKVSKHTVKSTQESVGSSSQQPTAAALAAASSALLLQVSTAMPSIAAPEGIAWNVVAPTSENLPALMVPLICLLLPACAMAQLFVWIEKYESRL